MNEFNFSKGKFHWMVEVLNWFVNKLPFYLYYLIALHNFYFLIKLTCHQFMLFVFILWYKRMNTNTHFHCTRKPEIC